MDHNNNKFVRSVKYEDSLFQTSIGTIDPRTPINSITYIQK